MISQHRLVAAVLVSILLHATGWFLITALNQPGDLALTAKGGKIQAVLIPTAPPLRNEITTSKAAPLQNSVADIAATSGNALESTPSATEPKTSSKKSTQNSDVFLPQEYLTRQPRPESELSLENIPQPAQPGTFQMRVWINQRGETVHIETDETTAPAQFIQQIAERFRATRFVPGERHGLPVASIIRIEISY